MPAGATQGEDYERELTQWLAESGRRRALGTPESAADLLSYLEQLAGRTLASREDILQYLRRLQADESERAQADGRRRSRREALFLALLGIAAAQYYFWDVSLQIASMHKVHYFVPPPSGVQRL
jgi:hypothetical protein